MKYKAKFIAQLALLISPLSTDENVNQNI